MSPEMRPISLVGGWFLVRLGMRIVPLLVLCLGLATYAKAQTGPLCSLTLSFPSGPAPLTVTATGGCADATGNVTSEVVSWGDGGGPKGQTPIPLGSFAAFSVQHTYMNAGTFTVTLAAMDDTGAQTSTSQSVVVPANAPPTCTLTVTPLTGAAPLPVNASGNCTDPENDITSITISWGEGPNTPATSGSHTYNKPGTFTVTITAMDSAGNTGSASQTVTVTAPNQPPSCNLQVNPDHGTAPLTVTATGNCTDPQGQSLTTVINWGDGSSTAGATGTHTFAAGTFTVVLTATDTSGLSGSASHTVNVTTVPNPGPTCALSVSPSNGTAPLTVSANGNCSDPQSAITTTVLNWGDGTSAHATTGTHTYSAPGSYSVTLTATDSTGASGSASQTVSVTSAQNAPPQCSLTVSPASGQVPVTVTVTPNCSDPENDISSIVVDFGDGFYASASAGSTLSHTFAWAGSFQVAVTATDKAGNVSNPASQTVSTTDIPTMFVAVSNGQIKQFDETGKSLKTLNTNQGGTITGMAFDWLDSLYSTDFTGNAVTKFNGNGDVTGNFGSGYNCQPESIAFDNLGNAYVGETGCSHALLKLDAYGNLVAAYNVTTEVEGSDWVDVAADQCTIYYTSQGTTVFRYNACTGQQQSPFATGLSTALAVKILGDDSVLVADKRDIIHFDSGGRVLTKYTAAGENCWVSLALDPDGKSFWAVDYCSSDVVRFDINSANQLAKFNSGSPVNTVYGIGMRDAAAHPTPAGPLIASSQNLTAAAGQSASFTLAFVPSGAAANQNFTFSCANLPVGASCQFSPQSATIAPTGATVQVTITTNSGSAANVGMFGSHIFACWFFLSGLLFAGDIRRNLRRRTAWRWLGIILVILGLGYLLGCSGATKSPPGNAPAGGNAMPTASTTTPAATYPIIVRATTNSFQSSTIVNLTVQ